MDSRADMDQTGSPLMKSALVSKSVTPLNIFSSAPLGLRGGAAIFKEIANKGQWQVVYRHLQWGDFRSF